MLKIFQFALFQKPHFKYLKQTTCLLIDIFGIVIPNFKIEKSWDIELLNL